MARARRPHSPDAFHPRGAPIPVEIRFPRAVAGEQFDRYAKSVWTEAQSWLSAHWTRATHGALTALDARLKLRAIAAVEIGRHLNAQEEQLLSEIVTAAWNAQSDSRDPTPLGTALVPS
jgi:hypothetical protein